MKRRGFLGFLGGAAVAGPAAAKAAITKAAPVMAGELSSKLSVNAISGGMGIPNPAGRMGVISAIDRMAKLKRFLSGEDTPDADPYDLSRRRQIMAEHRVMAIRSISQAARMHMLSRDIDRISRERDRGYWMLELKELMAGER